MRVYIHIVWVYNREKESVHVCASRWTFFDLQPDPQVALGAPRGPIVLLQASFRQAVL